jgi:hypothetical protein
MTRDSSDRLSEAQKRKWDVRLGLISTFVAVSGFLVGVWQFNQGERNKVKLESTSIQEKDRIDLRRKLWLERLETYRATADTIGSISAHSTRDKDLDKQLRNFENKYWGTMILVEDENVEKAMAKFRDTAQDFRDGFKNADQLRRAADRVVLALKNSVETDPVARDLQFQRQDLNSQRNQTPSTDGKRQD